MRVCPEQRYSALAETSDHVIKQPNPKLSDVRLGQGVYFSKGHFRATDIAF